MTDIERTFRDHLRSRERRLDHGIEARLKEARRLALEQPDRRFAFRVWLPVSGIALASVVVVALLFSPVAPLDGGGERTASADMASTEDLDFYYWLAETQSVTES